MDITGLQPWAHDSADQMREEDKRGRSPCSFFYSQGHELVLAAQYFDNTRLTPAARGGVALKHRHRIHLALFGQLMASLEYLLKDFVAQVIDNVNIYDHKIQKANWIKIDSERILNSRAIKTSAGAMLLHSTMGWHEPQSVIDRYSNLFEVSPIDTSEIGTLERLWILRHSVAHNAGLVIGADAARGGMPHLSGNVADINEEFISDTFDFLCQIARRMAVQVGARVIQDWLRTRVASGADYQRDKETYKALKLLATFVDSRITDLPTPKKGEYTAAFAAANPPGGADHG